jgi:two-component system, LytTR family, sensor kinase
MIVAATWIIPALLGGVDALGQHALWGGTLNWGGVLFTTIDWLMYGAFTPFIFRLSARWPLTRRNLAPNAIRHLLMSLVFCVAWASAGTILRAVIDPRSFDGGVAHWFASWVLTTLPFGASVYLAMVGIEHAIRYFTEARDRETQMTRLAEQLTSAKLSALQAQLNPHFLFNSLNTVAVLVRDNETRRATDVIEHLSDVLRRTLSRSQESETPLEEELDLVREYLTVEQARFSDRLRPSIDADPSLLSAAVPSFALQHLVENAIRHGISRRTGAGEISIVARRAGDTLELSVSDDGAGITTNLDAPGHGLENTRERLRTLYGERTALVVTPRLPYGTTAMLRIPYREIPLGAISNAAR